jgi:agmatine/peptidylarginine deiminase
MTKLRVLAFSTVLLSSSAFALPPDQKNLPIHLAPKEEPVRLDRSVETSIPPVGKIRSLGEWEASDAVMTLWTNPSWIRALAERGPVKLFADDAAGVDWWKSWLSRNNIPQSTISYLVVPTDSIWIRDYGPWFILNGKGAFGIVDTVYNRPRRLDDLVPQAIGKMLNLPVYKSGLVHTGGNYYNDGVGGGFSSTLVFTENSQLSSDEVKGRMHDFLGIERYTTSPLAPRITIEHIDTFGKLVAPDTWVFSEFPAGSKYRADSERMVELLKTLKSPYGTPYKIFRMPMSSKSGSGENYKAYINSFISNKALYFPTYNSETDEQAKAVYQAALPGYEIVGVDSGGTEWGDSVHCRSRNLLTRDAVFIFPSLLQVKGGLRVAADIYSSPGQNLAEAPILHWFLDDVEQSPLTLTSNNGRDFSVHLPAGPGVKVKLYIEARDSGGKMARAPRFKPFVEVEVADVSY